MNWEIAAGELVRLEQPPKHRAERPADSCRVRRSATGECPVCSVYVARDRAHGSAPA